MTGLPRRILWILILAAAYTLAGRLGLMLDAVSGFAALVWAPTGLALAATLLLGYWVWPGIALGALLVNVLSGASIAVAAGIAAGNALEALAGAYLLRRIPGFEPELRRVIDVLGLALFAATVAPTISASIGVTSLSLGGQLPPDQLFVTWTSWWLGDGAGALVVAPLVLTWSAGRVYQVHGRKREALALAISLAAASAFVFLRERSFGPMLFLETYLIFAPLIWAALRFLAAGAATATFAVSAVAVIGTVLGRGPFIAGELNERLWALQAFIGLIAVTFLLVGALSTERRETERDLVRAKELAETASSAKSRFLAVMSHELRTPLSSIVGFADLLESEIAGPMQPLQKQHASRIRRAAWNLVSIIDGILTFSRAEAGQETVDLQVVDTHTIVDEVVALLEPLASAKGIALRVGPNPRVEISTDAGKLRQILLNLVGNAVKYSARGVVDVRASKEADEVVFRVRDEGSGIPAEQLERIFEPFRQVRGNPTDVSTGTGLGLSVSSMLTKLLGGTLTVESLVGEGSTFTLRLPVGAATSVATSSVRPAGQSTPGAM